MRSLIEEWWRQSTLSSWLIILSGLGFSYIAGFAVYNVFFHRLRKYPGPKLWSASGARILPERWKNTLYTANPAI
ncbi:unnamed protein product [Clonostachys rosea f. rosea IK726]|uniref:Uncharacterized protein n=1 Tax=Clonostachys rosea f. rosea IK726 TaxID=1349383 RepID=A0ACA9UCG0_BIOOC|nr:unnamed protein product [Clonostachys rosea f. rosea IK726]